MWFLERMMRFIGSKDEPAADWSSTHLFWLVGKIAVIIFAVEFLIMLVVFRLDGSGITDGIIDSTLLTTIASPLIYFAVALPFVRAARTANMSLQQQLLESRKLLQDNAELQNSLRDASEEIAILHEQILQGIGADIHDGPTQQLTFALMRLDSIGGTLADAGSANANFNSIRDALTSAMQEMRSICMNLSLPQLDAMALGDVVKLALTSHVGADSHNVELNMDVLPEHLAISQKVCIYRVVQEAIANARKHGQCDRIWVDIRANDALILSISDNGIGMQARSPSEGLGINGMKARTRALGGQLQISDRPGGGTVVSASIPI